MPAAIRRGHGVTAWHCSCHGTMHAVPSLAADCEDRTVAASRKDQPHALAR